MAVPQPRRPQLLTPSLPAFRYTGPEQEAFPMQTRILGTTMPVLEVDLNPDESVFSEFAPED